MLRLALWGMAVTEKTAEEQQSMHSTLNLSELDNMIGRLFVAGIPGPEMDDDTEALIRDHALGGVILFARNIENPVQLASLCNSLQGVAMKHQGIPLFLAIDQEGGRVVRLREPFTLFPGNSAFGNDTKPVAKAVEFGKTTAKEMTLVGLNMNMAPVVDVRRGEPERHLDGRIFSDDPQKVAMLGQYVVKSLQENGVMYACSAENLSYSSPPSWGSPEAIINIWMGSSSHRANLLNPHFGQLGIGVVDGNGRRVVTLVLINR